MRCIGFSETYTPHKSSIGKGLVPKANRVVLFPYATNIDE